MHVRSSLALALALSAGCSGCHWTGGGFHADGAEMPRLRQALDLKPGKTVADVGAGKGELTMALARELGSSGSVFSTDIEPRRVQGIREMVAAAGFDNVTVIEGRTSETALPPNCCDVIVLRRVYHHLDDPARFNASLFASLRPGALLAVIDFPPPFFWPRRPFGVPAKDVIAEATASGFESVRLDEDWPGRGPLASYCALFRKPR